VNYKLLWQEEFLPTADHLPNSEIWNFDLGDGTEQGNPGWGNQEREYYIRDCVAVDFGLTITAKRTTPEQNIEAYYGRAEWVSSKIHTAGKVNFQYGRLEFDVDLPIGGGSWPALWMLGANIESVTWPSCGEIDIFEGAGNRPREVRGTLHGPGYSANEGLTGDLQSPKDLASERHTFAIDWLPDEISWYANSERYLTISKTDHRLVGKEWPFNSPFYLVINLAMGGWFAGDIVKGFDECTFKVHAIRHYSINGIGQLFTDQTLRQPE